MLSCVIGKGGDKAIRSRHHWIYSDAVLKYPDKDFNNGEILQVLDEKVIKGGPAAHLVE